MMYQEISQPSAMADAGVPEVSQSQAGIIVNINKFKLVLSSRKCWAVALVALSAAATFAIGESTAWQLIQAFLAVAASNATGVVTDDAGFHIGGKYHIPNQTLEADRS